MQTYLQDEAIQKRRMPHLRTVDECLLR